MKKKIKQMANEIINCDLISTEFKINLLIFRESAKALNKAQKKELKKIKKAIKGLKK